MNTLTLQNTLFIGCIAIFSLLFSQPLNAQGWDAPTTVFNNTGGGPHYAQKLLEVNGRPAVAYYDFANFRLAYKRAGNAVGSNWPSSEVVVDTDWRSGNNSIDMAIVNGNPAIVSDSPVGKDVRYTRANDANGTSWSTTVIAAENIATSYGGDLFLDLEVVNGRPAIAYYDGDNKDLYYVRANDANGTSWGTPMLLESTGDVGTHLSLAVFDGKPSICHYKENTGDLRYIRASDADGTTWQSSFSVVTAGDVGKHTDMRVIEGHPAIVYYDATQQKVMYTRSTISSGNLWWDGEYSVANNVEATDLDLMLVDGKPGVAYRSVTDGNPKFLISDSQHGWTWTRSKTVTIDDSANDTGRHLSAAVIDGKPAIIHRDFTNTNVLYTRSENANGLPVEMTYFKATAEEKTALLRWETASELNNSGFHIEHGTNGRDFETIGWVDGNGTSSDVNTYRFIDENPSSGMNYYRLLQEDFDGTSAYSEIEAIQFETKSVIKLFPNPTRIGTATSLQILSEPSQNITIHIMDASGKIVSSTQQSIEEGNQTLSIPNQMLGVGIYIISVIDNNGTQSIKLSVTE